MSARHRWTRLGALLGGGIKKPAEILIREVIVLGARRRAENLGRVIEATQEQAFMLLAFLRGAIHFDLHQSRALFLFGLVKPLISEH